MTLKFKRAILTTSICLLSASIFAQQKVSGTVKDANGEPIIGVNIMLNGKSVAVTDLNGKYTISGAKSGSKIEFSYIGFEKQAVKVGNNDIIDIVLNEDDVQLDEVVVVGYGTMKRNDLTGAVGSVDTKQLNAKGATSVLENLQGSVPGVNITRAGGRTSGNIEIEIRGKNSISSQSPIYVVDGIVCSNIDFLNPQDIERVDILKDASSTAIYGSRATAGVVMVTTKTGSSTGSKAQKPTISYDGYYGVSKVARMPEFQDADEFYSYRFMKFLEFADPTNINDGRPVMTNTDLGRCMLLDTNSGIYRLKEVREKGLTHDWPSLVLQDGSQQNHYLAISGATETTNYHIGLGDTDEKGTFKNDGMDKFTIKGSFDAKLSKHVSAGLNVNLARINKDYASDNAVRNAFHCNPYMQPYDKNGNLNRYPGSKDVEELKTPEFQFTSAINPLIYLEDQTSNTLEWLALANVWLEIRPMEGVSFRSTFSPTFNYSRYGFYEGTEAGQTQNTAKRNTNQGFSYTWDNMLTYNRTFNKIHNLNVMALISATASKNESENLTYNNVLDGTYWWALGTSDQGYNYANSNTGYAESSLLSYALRANYTLLGRYMATATIRWDGSSKFAQGNRWGSFPSMALAWRISEESFMENTRDWLSNLKLRLSYGVTGNNNVSNYATQQTIGSSTYYPFGSVYMQGVFPGSIIDKNLKWEKAHETNVGLDFGFLGERIRGSIDVYNKKSTDLLYDVVLPLETGGASMKTNIGSVRNKGIEISLTTENIVNRDWHWTTTFSFAHNKNEVLEINGTGNLYTGGSTGNLFIGQPYHNIYGYEWCGIVSDRDMIVPDHEIAKAMGFTPGEKVQEALYYNKCYGLIEGNPIIRDVDGDGRYGEADKKIYKSDPDWTGSFTSNLTYKNLDFSFSIYAKQNFTIYSSFYNDYLNMSNRGQSRLEMDWYIPAGTLIDCDGQNPDGTMINPKYQETTHYGSYPFPNNAMSNGGVGTPNWHGSTNSFVDGSYVKVKHITLGYTLPAKWMKKIGGQSLRLYGTVTNPFVFTDYKGYDPEWAAASSSNDSPSLVTWMFGANIKI